MLSLFHQKLRTLLPLPFQQLLQALGRIARGRRRSVAAQHRGQRWRGSGGLATGGAGPLLLQRWLLMRLMLLLLAGKRRSDQLRRRVQAGRRVHAVRLQLHAQLVGHLLGHTTAGIQLVAQHVCHVYAILEDLEVLGVAGLAVALARRRRAGLGAGRTGRRVLDWLRCHGRRHIDGQSGAAASAGHRLLDGRRRQASGRWMTHRR